MPSVSNYSVVSNLSRNIYRRYAPATMKTESHTYMYVLESGWLIVSRLILGDILCTDKVQFCENCLEFKKTKYGI